MQVIDKQELLSGTARIEDFDGEFLNCFLFPSDLEVEIKISQKLL